MRSQNALIRQYIPKGSSFIDITTKQISIIQNKLNYSQERNSDSERHSRFSSYI
ncbi:hypothetical protein HMPREF1989_01076 [Porphyromonas gingivalis F0566]|nr:hypothetical protein HMPREF1989_01076 [Porphyromonas gingivalis F0566]